MKKYENTIISEKMRGGSSIKINVELRGGLLAIFRLEEGGPGKIFIDQNIFPSPPLNK